MAKRNTRKRSAGTKRLSEQDDALFAALQQFAANVTANFKALAAGEPEAQLTNPTEGFLSAVGKALGYRRIVAKRESQLEGRLGRPDYAVLANKLLVGYVELKEPGKGADPNRFKGHDRDQWKRFMAIPSLIYTDGNEWALYQSGERAGKLVRLSGDITTSGKSAVKLEDLEVLKPLLTDFFSWDPIVPQEAKGLAKLLAPLCRMLRQEVADALKDTNSSLTQLAGEWRQLLFPDADDERFADAYAQTVTFALLLARSEGANTTDEDLHDPIRKLSADHALLSRALQVLTDPHVRDEIAPPLRLLQRVIGRVQTDTMKASGESDPWLYFYEFFLAEYDKKLRKDTGAYYTPVEVVRAQVRLIDRLLVGKLHKPMGFSDPDVFTLDPAVGTGTYLLGVIDRAVQRITDEEEGEGEGAVADRITQLGKNIFGFEIMVGPYAVAQLRISRALMDRGAKLPKDGPGVYLTDTLESPHAEPPQAIMGFTMRELAKQHQRAVEVKDRKPILVCLGNPPYDRHEAADETNIARTGGWVRYGDPFKEGSLKDTKEIRGKRSKKPVLRKLSPAGILKRRQEQSILYTAFVKPAMDAGHGGDVKNLYNLYIYFWRWALWKVFEHSTAPGPGVVSYISAASYLDGDAFVGVREHMRRWCDEIWIIDLGGEGRGTRRTDNVFAIQTPVAIALAVRYGTPKPKKPAKVHYTRIDGSREEKLAKLDAITDFTDLKWQTCPDDWHAPLRPGGKGSYFDSPLLTDLMPWQHSGVQLKRKWPIAPDVDTLTRRWEALLAASDRGEAFRESGDRVIAKTYKPLLPTQKRDKPIANLPRNAPIPHVQRYAYRSFDRYWIIADGRLMSRPRPELWTAHNARQVYVTSLLTKPLGTGPAVTACAVIPDLDHFSGRGAKDVVPLFRDAAATEPNIAPGLLESLGQQYNRKVTPEDFLAYIYGLLAQPAFTKRFEKELETRELRVPLTKDGGLFEQVAEFGRRLLWLHTYAQRYTGRDRPKGRVPHGRARCARPVQPQNQNYPDEYAYDPTHKRLTVGAGSFEPVEPEIFEFEVSGLKVVQSWLGYRMRSGKGRKSSPLDEIRPRRWTAAFTTELLELLWILEYTVAEYPAQEKLLDAVLTVPTLARMGG